MRTFDLSFSAVILYGCLINRCGPRGHCWPGQATLARDMRRSVRSVQAAIQDLKKAGLIAVENGGRRSNVYRLLLHPAILAERARRKPRAVPRPGQPRQPGRHGNGSYETSSCRTQPAVYPAEKCARINKEEIQKTPLPPTRRGEAMEQAPAPAFAESDSRRRPKAVLRQVKRPGKAGRIARLSQDELAEADKTFGVILAVWPENKNPDPGKARRLWRYLWRSGALPDATFLVEAIKDNLERNFRWLRGYVPYLANWLWGRRWEEELPEAPKKALPEAHASGLEASGAAKAHEQTSDKTGQAPDIPGNASKKHGQEEKWQALPARIQESMDSLAMGLGRPLSGRERASAISRLVLLDLRRMHPVQEALRLEAEARADMTEEELLAWISTHFIPWAEEHCETHETRDAKAA
ncbi:MAG: helix-turn-helix domain-containing protein [Acidobacteriota bacterium]